MPIKMTYKLLNDTQFMKAVVKLAKYENWKDPKIAWNVAKFVRRYDSETQLAQELYIKMVKQYAKLDEKGRILPIEGQPNSFEIPEEKEAEWEKARADFNSIEFEVDCHQIPMEKLDGVGLSAADLNILEPLLIPVDLSQGL